MMKTRITRFSKRSLSTIMAFLVMLSAIGFGSIIRAGAAGNTMYVCVSDATMASAGATKVSTNVRQNQYSNGSWREVQMTSTNKFYNGKRIYSVSNMEGTDWGGLGRLEIILRDDNGTFKAEKWIYSDDNWHTSSNYAGKLYNYDGSTFVGAYSDASYANGFTTGDYYIHNNVNGAWYGNGTSAPQMTKSGNIYYYDFYLKKNEVNTSNYLIFKFWDSSDSLQIGPDYESDHRCTLSTSDSWSSTVQSIQNYGDKDTAWQVNTSGFTTDKFNRVRITFDPTTLANSRNGRVKFTKTELANMDPTFSTTSFTKGTSYNLTSLVGVTSGSNAGTVSYSTYQYYDTSWHTISSPASWTPSATNITKLRVTATDGGVITTAGTTKNAVTARTETKETAITVSLATHTVSRSSAPSNGTLQLSSDNSTWGTSALTVAEGSNYYVKATPNTGYKINTLTVAGSTITDANNSTSAYTHTGTMGTSNVTASCTFSPQVYTITYKDQGDAAFSGTHASGYPTTHTYGTATTLKSASKTGCTFGGWYTSDDCSGTAVTSLGATAYTSNITLYAKWILNSYNITLSETNASGGTIKVDGTTASTATHGSHTLRVDAPSGWEISSISSTGASWTNNESYAVSGTVNITGNYSISVTYVRSSNPALNVKYIDASGSTVNASTGPITAGSAHYLEVTFTNQNTFTVGTSYSWNYTKNGTQQASGSGSTANSSSAITLKSWGAIDAGTYVFTVTAGTKTKSITVNVNQSRKLTVTDVANTTVSGSYTSEFGESKTISAAGQYWCNDGTTYTVTYEADAYYRFDNNNSTTTKTYSGTISSNVTTNPSVSEKQYSLTLNKSLAGAAATSMATAQTVKAVTGSTVSYTAQTGYTIKSWTVTSGTVYVGGVAKSSGTTISTAGNLSNVTLHANATIRANFDDNSYTLTVNQKKGSGTATQQSTKTAYYHTNSTVSASEISGYKVTGWQVTSGTVYVNGTAYTSSSGAQSVTAATTYSLSNVTIRAAATIQFNYTESKYTVTVASATQGSKALGTVSPSSVSAGIDTKPTITATAKTGYEFTGWTDSNLTFTNANSASTTVSASAAGTATANFRRTRVYLDVASYWTIGSNNVNHFAAYFFWNNDTNNEWVTMTQVDGVAGKYYADIPAAAVTAANYKLVFVALNNASNAWGNKVYQTGDLTPCASGETLKNLYTLTSTGGGSWSASPYFPPRTYSVIVNAAEHGTVGGVTSQTVQVPDEGTAYTLPTPQASYGYKFTGWKLISGSVVYNNTTYSTANTVFSTNASTAILANQASSVQAVFDYDDSMNLYIVGRFRVYDTYTGSPRTATYVNGSSGSWSTTATNIKFQWNETNHYYYVDTNSSIAELSATLGDKQYFRVYDQSNSKNWQLSANQALTESNEGTHYTMTLSGDKSFYFNETSNSNGPVKICFDPVTNELWFTIPARHTAELGTISRTVRSTTTTDTNGGTVKINNGTSSINVSEGTNYAIKVTPVSGYQLTALTVNGTSIISGHENATSEFTINRAMGEGNSSYKETVSATFTAIQYSVTVGSNSTNSSNTVKFKVNSDSTQYTEKTDVTVADTITPVVAVNSSAGYNIRSIKLQEKTGTSSYTDRVQLANNSATQMKAYNARIYVAYGAISPVMSNSIAATTGASPENISVSTYTINNAYAGQAVTITPSVTTNGTITYASSNLTNGYGTATLSYNSSTKKFTFTSPKYIGDSAGANPTYTFRITPTNTPETGISASGDYITVTIKVIYSATQQAYMNLKTKYDEYAGYEITSDDIESGWSDFNSAMTTANTALGTFPNSIPEWNASDSYTAKKTALETAYSNLVFKETTIYVLSKYEHSNSSYVNIYLFNNSTATRDPSPIFYTDTSLTTINNTARNYHMTYEGETNDHKHLYSFTYRGHQEFIIYRRSQASYVLDSNSKLTGDVDMRNAEYGDYYIDVKNTDVTSSPSVTSASTFTDFSISATGADSDLMVGQCKEGATGYTVSQIQSWLGITFNGSLASTSSQTVAQTYTITGPVGRGVPTEATVDSNHNWVPLKPGRYTVSLSATLGTDSRDSAGATFSATKDTVGNTQTVLDLFVAYDDIEIYADMNGNVGTPTIHFTYQDTNNNNEYTDLPYEFDMVTGSESIYSYTISVSTLKDSYGLDLLNDTVTVGGQSYNGIKIDHISIDSVNRDNSSFVIERDVARTGTLWLKADSTNMKTFNKIAYGSSTRTFKAVLREDGEDDVDFNNSFAEVSGTGIITDEPVTYTATESYDGTGSQTQFTLPAIAPVVTKVTVGNDVKTAGTDYTFDQDSGVVTFTSAPASGTDNVVIEYTYISYEYTSFYAAKDTTATYNFSYTLRAKAQTDITHKDGNDTKYYYFDHWERINGSTTTTTGLTEADGADINILKAPIYSTNDSNITPDPDVTYVAVYKLTSTQKRVQITYKFQDYDTDDENYVYDSDKPLKDASYTKTVKLSDIRVNNATVDSITTANAAKAAASVQPIIKSNYFDYTLDENQAVSSVTETNDGTNMYKFEVTMKETPHKYKIIPGNEDVQPSDNKNVQKGFYQQSHTYTTTVSNPVWYIKGANNSEIVIGTGATYKARFGIYQNASTETEDNVSYNYDVYTIYVKTGDVSAYSSIAPAHQETYYDQDTPKVRHNFYIIDAMGNTSGTFVGAGVLYATLGQTTSTDPNSVYSEIVDGTTYYYKYRQSNAGTVLGSAENTSNFITGVLNPNNNINTAKYGTEFKAQTINNIGFRYLPYSGNESIIRYSNELKAYMYTFAGENTNSASLEGQKLRVFSFFVYKDTNNKYQTVVSSMYAQVERYIAD